MAAIAGLTIIFGAVYMLRMYKKVMQGETNALTAVFADIHGSEKIALGIILYFDSRYRYISAANTAYIRSRD